jgi:hypothetical protein
MGNMRNTLRNSDEFQEIAEPAAATADAVEDETADTVADAADAIINLEQGNAEFWLDVLTVVLLFLIYREMARQNGGMP